MNIYQSDTYWKWIPIHESLFYHIVQSDVKPCNGLEFSNISSPLATTASHFLHYLLFDQLYAKKCISAVLWQNPIKHPPAIGQMYSVVSIGWPGMENPQNFHKPPSNKVSSHFTIETLLSVASPFFSSLQPSKPPPNNTQDFNRSWQGPSHVIFLLQTKFPF